MELIRGWPCEYAPDIKGGLRLTKGHVYRQSEEEGLGDPQEGELRARMRGTVSREDSHFPFPVSFTLKTPDEPDVVVEDLMPGETRKHTQHLLVDDSGLDSPFVLCLSRKPNTKSEWEVLRDALPQKDTWTLTDDVPGLIFEIEWGIKRWLALNGVTQHEIHTCKGWVAYPYDTIPASVEPSNLGAVLTARWLRKNRRFSNQQEYRVVWEIRSPQMERFPDSIDIELTRTGLGMLRPWSPPA